MCHCDAVKKEAEGGGRSLLASTRSQCLNLKIHDNLALLGHAGAHMLIDALIA
jgi:hypothetical protein